MGRRLFIVEDAFFIKGRGLVPVPGIVPQGEERFHVSDPIVLKLPDGSRLEWTIGGIEMIHCTPPRLKTERSHPSEGPEQRRCPHRFRGLVGRRPIRCYVANLS